MRTRILSLNIVGLIVGACAVGCTASTFMPDTAGDAGAADGSDSSAPPVNGGGGDAGDAATEAAAPPPGCDPSKLPTDDLCVVNDAEGVFVSSSLGASSGDGTREHPLASLDAALTAAKSANKRVYACAETYAEAIHFQNGVSVFGYFDCKSGWTTSSTHASVKAPTSPAAVANNIASATRIEAVDIIAPDFTSAQSSIALIANSSPGLTIKNATIHAGTGGKGADGVAGIQLTDSGSAKNGGNTHNDGETTNFTISLLNSSAPTAGSNTCSGESGHDGGPGGVGGSGGYFKIKATMSGNVWVSNGGAEAAGNPTAATVQTAQGGAVEGFAGYAGSSGANGVDGVSGISIGSITSTGYATSDGTEGTSGNPGQGGGGSGGKLVSSIDYPPNSYTSSDYTWGEPGASGGAGGCPGLHGTHGSGGGASIAIVAIQGAFTLDTVNVESSIGGAGGRSGDASVETAGGSAGKGGQHTDDAGAGGAGGLAGVSGNGGGGPSIGIAYQGTKPQTLASKITQGAGGSGVASRVGADGKTVPASADGLSQDSYAF